MASITSSAPLTRLPYSSLRHLLSVITGDAKHLPSATSTLDVLWVLYDRILRIDPANLDDPGRDRFYLSKGHGPASYYAVLAAKGFIPLEWLHSMGAFESALGYHPDHKLIPGVEISTGSLGHGLPLAVGAALGLRAQKNPARVIVLLGDGELDEGSNHEAIAYAARARLDNITAVVIDNQSATHGWPDGIARRFKVEGWRSDTISGRDHDQIEAALKPLPIGRPNVVVSVVEPKEAH